MPRLTRNTTFDRTRGGFSLAEVMIAATVVIVALMGMVGSVTSSAVMGDSGRESSLAYEALHSAVEQMHGQDFSQVLALYNDDPADDPDGPGTAPGQSFAVAGLTPREDDEDGQVGAILLPLHPGPPSMLREDHEDAGFGMPRDLNGDGVIDADDRADDYLVLPVVVRLEWTGRSGERQVEMECLLSPR